MYMVATPSRKYKEEKKTKKRIQELTVEKNNKTKYATFNKKSNSLKTLLLTGGIIGGLTLISEGVRISNIKLEDLITKRDSLIVKLNIEKRGLNLFAKQIEELYTTYILDTYKIKDEILKMFNSEYIKNCEYAKNIRKETIKELNSITKKFKEAEKYTTYIIKFQRSTQKYKLIDKYNENTKNFLSKTSSKYAILKEITELENILLKISKLYSTQKVVFEDSLRNILNDMKDLKRDINIKNLFLNCDKEKTKKDVINTQKM